MKLKIALLGDYDHSIVAHQAIPRALQLAAVTEGVTIEETWIHTSELGTTELKDYGGVWCAPGSPYSDTQAVLATIGWVRETGKPFLGTCGGFQHAVLEAAGSIWGIQDPSHAELDPDSSNQVIVPLICSLVEKRGEVTFLADSRIQDAYQSGRANEGYHCSFGLGPLCQSHLQRGPLRATAWDLEGDVRALELDDHPFFVCTLFQPERLALKEEVPPLVRAFVAAVKDYVKCVS